MRVRSFIDRPKRCGRRNAQTAHSPADERRTQSTESARCSQASQHSESIGGRQHERPLALGAHVHKPPVSMGDAPPIETQPCPKATVRGLTSAASIDRLPLRSPRLRVAASLRAAARACASIRALRAERGSVRYRATSGRFDISRIHTRSLRRAQAAASTDCGSRGISHPPRS